MLIIRLVALAGCGLALSGCNRLGSLSGAVTFDGKPVEHALIRFESLPRPSESVEGGSVVNGRFEIAPKIPLRAGSYQVIISAPNPPKASRKSAGPGDTPVGEELIPARYNTESTLVVEVKAGTRNEFTFTLER
jgi:hypothetical protein